MKMILTISAMLFTMNTLSSGFCFSHGQCQSVADESTACFKVQLKGSKNCEIRCNTIYAGSYCDFFPNKKYGKCKDESFKNDIADSTECQNAIPEDIFKD